MRRAAWVLCLLLPLAACGEDTSALGTQPEAECTVRFAGDGPPPSTLEQCQAYTSAQAEADPSPSEQGYICSLGEDDTDLDPSAPDFMQRCLERQAMNHREQELRDYCESGYTSFDGMDDEFHFTPAACGTITPYPTVSYGPEPSPPAPDTLESAALLLSNGGEVTLVKGLSPEQVLTALVPGSSPQPSDETCDDQGNALESSDPLETCITARVVRGWTVAVDLGSGVVGSGPSDLLARLSRGGHEVVHVADHVEADAPFVVARDGREVRRFDFCSEGSADDGAALPEEEGLDLRGCGDDRLELVQRLTGIAVTEDLLTNGDRLAVVSHA